LGIIVTCGGTIMVASRTTNSTFFIRNSYFAKTYPIRVLVTMTARVIVAVIRILLRNHSAIGAFSNAVLYPSSVHSVGKNLVRFVRISALVLNEVINIQTSGYIIMTDRIPRKAMIT